MLAPTLLAELNEILRANNKMITVSRKTDLWGKQLRIGFKTEELEKNRTKTKQGNFGWLAGKFSTVNPVRLQSSHPLPGDYYSCTNWKNPKVAIQQTRAFFFFFWRNRSGRKTSGSYLWIQCLTSSSVPEEYKVTSSWQKKALYVKGCKIFSVGFISETLCLYSAI